MYLLVYSSCVNFYQQKPNPEDVLSPNTKILVESATKQGGDSLER